MQRRSGILMHITSLDSDYGIGTLGNSAYKFVDFLNKADQRYWQLLPIGPTGYGDSPYSSFSTFAGNPYFIDLDFLCEEGYLDKSDYENIDWHCEEDKVNFGELYRLRYPVLRKAMQDFLKKASEDFYGFLRFNGYWLEDYALFMALKDANGGKCWLEWDEGLKNRHYDAIEAAKVQYADDIMFYKALQYHFFKQWRDLKEYANSNDVELIGDIPIYVALDSVDVWASKELFQLDENNNPSVVAGCPPDGFSATGQLWGNPIYAWDHHANTNFEWWIKRIAHLMSVYDVLRIDHFRGFDSYWAIPYGDKDATRGEWRKGPGIALFNELKAQKGDLPIIAEDLGFLTDSVKQLLKDSGYPGMKVLEFAFDARETGSNDYLPHKYNENCVVYCGTHDNSTIKGWIKAADKADVDAAMNYMLIKQKKDFVWNMLSMMWMSVANTAIAQAQDILELDDKARMNIPSTSSGNWMWRAKKGVFTDELAEKVAKYTRRYGRSNKN